MIGSVSLRARILSGIVWKAASQVTLELTRMVVALLLARTPAPHDSGLAAMVLVFSGLRSRVIARRARNHIIIQRRDAQRRRTAFSIVLRSSAGAGPLPARALLGLAPSRAAAASFFERARRPLALRRLSVGFLVSSLGSTQMALLVRRHGVLLLTLAAADRRAPGLEPQSASASPSLASARGGSSASCSARPSRRSVLHLAADGVVSLCCVFSTTSISKLDFFAGYASPSRFPAEVLPSCSFASVLIGRVPGAAVLATDALGDDEWFPCPRPHRPRHGAQVSFPGFARTEQLPGADGEIGTGKRAPHRCDSLSPRSW